MTTAAAAPKYVYVFGHARTEGAASMKNLLGGKGANLAEMCRLGIPVPSGFTISTEACTVFTEQGREASLALIRDEVLQGVAFVEGEMGKRFGNADDPLLLSVRSGARASMPGMMDTILNLGLNDGTYAPTKCLEVLRRFTERTDLRNYSTPDNAPLRGGKFTNFEGGINIPFLLKWKGHIPEGVVFNPPVSALDVFATAAAVAGSPLPTDRTYDGVDLLPHLGQAAPAEVHPALYWRSMYTKAVRQGRYKLIRDEKAARTVLFDLAADKSETTDLAARSPAVVEELLGKLSRWEADLRSPLWPQVMDYHHRDRDGVYYFPL